MSLLIALAVLGGLAFLAVLYVVAVWVIAVLVAETRYFGERVTLLIADKKEKKAAKKAAKESKKELKKEVQDAKTEDGKVDEIKVEVNDVIEEIK